MRHIIASIFFLFVCFNLIAQKVVRYDLYVTDTIVNYTGKNVKAIAINHQMPGPTLVFTEGDTAEIYVHNMMKEATSIHWHGIILPNEEDGVPFLTMEPIKPNSTYIYKFPIVQSGTYWYHSHSGLQQQSGLYGAFIIHKQVKDTLPEYTVILSDWTNERPMEVMRSLKEATDWYAIKKGSVQSYGEALQAGYFGQKIRQEWHRMFAMDVSDVYYDRFVINGITEQKLLELKAGQKVHLRIINGSSSTYFWLQYAGSKLTVVASDGQDVQPVSVDRMLIAIAETYDVIVTIPDNMSYEFKATSEDRSGFVSLWLGDGKQISLPKMPALKYFEGMKMMNEMNKEQDMQMSMEGMDMNAVMYPELSGDNQMSMPGMRKNSGQVQGQNPVTLNYRMLRATHKTTLDTSQIKELHFDLTGNMNRYVWSINNKPMSKADKILIHKGETVRVILHNSTMMRHPMHIHGHFFRMLNGQGDYAPLKDVMDIMPMETDTIEFAASYYGDWFFHCHILYHMMAGMGRIFSYDNSPANPQLMNPKMDWKMFLMDDKMWYPMANLSLHSQGVFGNATYANTYNLVDADWNFNYTGSYEIEPRVGRYLDQQQFLIGYVGADFRRYNISTDNTPDWLYRIENTNVATIGLEYTLPMFIKADLRIDNTGRVRFQLKRDDLPLTARLRLDGMINTDREYMVGVRYILTKYISVSVNYKDEYGIGGGMTFTY